MRILYFTSSDSPHDQRFLKAMVQSGHEPYALRLTPLSEDKNRIAGVHEIDWDGSPRKMAFTDIPRVVRQVKRIIRETNPDVVHAGPIQGPAYLAALAHARPLLAMSWGFDLMKIAQKNTLTKWITRYTLSHSAMLAVDCQAVKDQATRFGADPANIVIFPWGVDLEVFSPLAGIAKGNELRHQLGWGEQFVILGTRTWEPMYGMDVLAEAFSMAAAKEPQLRLILVGQGSQEQKIRAILQEGGVIDRVWFAGRVEQADLPGFYCAADLYVSPSHVDGSSISLLEALACGRPVLVSDIPGNQEWVEEGETGWLFEDYDESSLAGKLHEVIHSKELEKMSLNARHLVQEKADWNKSVHTLNQAYEKLVKRNKR